MKRRIIIEAEISDDEKSPLDYLSENVSTYPCTNCSNNPQNNPNASGFCNCILPTLWMEGGYRSSTKYTSTWTSTSTI